MKTRSLLLPLFALVTAATVSAQSSVYAANKHQNYLQTSATSVTPDPTEAFGITFQAATNVALTLPAGGSATLVRSTEDNRYILRQFFSTKAALDAAFPNGTYRMSGTGLPNLSLALTTDNYPVTTPQLTSVSQGAWNAGGVFVVNPSQAATLNFSTFSGYTNSGVAGHINFFITDATGGPGLVPIRLEVDQFSQPFGGAPAQPNPLTTYTIPAGTLTQGRVYTAWLGFDTIATMDTATVPGSAIGTLFSKQVRFYIAAQIPGTSTPPPVIVTPLASTTGVIGGTATFSFAVTVGGTRLNYQNSGTTFPIQFQWKKNGVEMGNFETSGGKYTSQGGDNLTINNLTAADAATYTVTVITAGGVVTTAPATLTFATPSAPVITAQPRGATVNAGSTLALTVAATGAPTPSYQWQKNGVAIPGATTDTLVLGNVATTTGGNYNAVVTNSVSSVLSNTAAIVITSGQPSRLPNLSVRTNLPSAQTLIVGFATTGTKTMLVRGIGPTLSVFGLSGVLPDPVIELYSSAAVKIDENNDWNESLSSVFSSVGAFALVAGSRDAALQRVCTGSYTSQIKSTGAGVVLVEVYETSGTGKLSNVSARNVVGTGDNILIAGFVVGGTAAKTLLIRGVGAKLAEFGVQGVLSDPKLEIYNDSGVKVAENDNWNPQLQSTARSVGAFDLTLGSRDAALLITLPPGSYTAQISGIGGTIGEAIVEVYEVP